MRLLVLGGTRFLGRGVVQAALDAGDSVTTFSRGESGPPPAGATALHGDRTRPDGLAALAAGEWDVVVDTSGYVPTVVGRSAKLLADRVGHYVFVSSINAYPGWPAEPVTRDSPTHECEPDAGPDDGAFDLERYGEYKVGSERAVDQFFAGRSTHVRAGSIVGPHDDTGRLTWWIRRIGGGGEVLVPGDPERTLRLIDARDLGAWCVHCGRTGVTGAYPATGPADQVSYGELFAACRAATGSAATFTWVAEDFLDRHEVQGWTELPQWLSTADAPAVWATDTTAAEQAGLTCRPMAETIADTAAWLDTAGVVDLAPHRRANAPGLDPGKEATLLAAWHAR
jgi:2'-hydroxyisoflavone reductase